MKLKTLKKLQAELNDHVAVVENLSSVQARCTELILENRELKKRISELEAAAMRRNAAPYDDIERYHDPFETPAKDHRMTLARYAERNGRKATEVLMKLLTLGHEGIHINSLLTENQLDDLDEAFNGADLKHVFDCSGSMFVNRSNGWKPRGHF
jgi:hypothetical protein